MCIKLEKWQSRTGRGQKRKFVTHPLVVVVKRGQKLVKMDIKVLGLGVRYLT